MENHDGKWKLYSWINADKITQKGWDNLCCNPRAVNLIEKNLDKLSQKGWDNLCFNKNATHSKFKCKRVTSKGLNSFFGKKGSTMFGKGGKHSTRKRHKPRKSRTTGSKN